MFYMFLLIIGTIFLVRCENLAGHLLCYSVISKGYYEPLERTMNLVNRNNKEDSGQIMLPLYSIMVYAVYPNNPLATKAIT